MSVDIALKVYNDGNVTSPIVVDQKIKVTQHAKKAYHPA